MFAVRRWQDKISNRNERCGRSERSEIRLQALNVHGKYRRCAAMRNMRACSRKTQAREGVNTE